MRRHFVLLMLLCSSSLTAADQLPRRGFFGAGFAPGEANTVVISAVLPGGPAEAAGLKPGDVVLTFDGKPVAAQTEIPLAVARKRAEEVVKLEIRRDGAKRVVDVQLQPLGYEQSPDFDVVYDAIPVRGALRRTIVTRPKQPGKSPAVLLVGGVGCYAADNPLFKGDAYREILHRLTREGFVTMRVEKSGMGDSQGAPCSTVDFETELDGYREGLRTLRSLPYVNSADVFLFGHSMGGIAGPLLAKDLPLRGLMVMATVGSGWFEYELENTRRQTTLSGASEGEVDRAVRERTRCLYGLFVENNDRPDGCPAARYPASLAYMRQVAATDLGAAWAASSAPVLVLYGQSDFVSGEQDHRYLVSRINRMNPGRATLMLIPQLDHFFLRTEDQRTSFALRSQPGEPEINLDWLPGMVKWMRARIS